MDPLTANLYTASYYYLSCNRARLFLTSYCLIPEYIIRSGTCNQIQRESELTRRLRKLMRVCSESSVVVLVWKSFIAAVCLGRLMKVFELVCERILWASLANLSRFWYQDTDVLLQTVYHPRHCQYTKPSSTRHVQYHFDSFLGAPCFLVLKFRPFYLP